MVNFGKKAVGIAVKQIKAGMEINDSYGAVYHYMDKPEREQFLKVNTLFKNQYKCLIRMFKWSFSLIFGL